MDSREAICTLFEKKGYKRMGLRDVPWPETSVNWLKQGYPTAKEKYIDDYSGKDKFADFGLTEYPADAIDYFDMDLVKCGFYWDVLPKKGFLEVLEEKDGWIITRNGAGAVLKTLKVLSGAPEHIDFAMTSREVWERDYKPHLLTFDPARVDVETMKAKYEKRRKEGRFIYFSTMFVWETLRSCLGDVCLYESMITEPEWIHDFCRTYTQFYKQLMDYVFSAVGKPDGVLLLEDLGYKQRLFCSPRTYADLIFPYYTELIEFLHSRGIYAMLHSCGCVTEALPLIARAGFDMLNPMEVKAGCDLTAYARQYKDNFVFMGGFDARILESGDLTLIRSEVTNLIKALKDVGARYIFGSDHSLSSNVSFESFKCAVDTYRELMWY
jgi:hypothetical protein